jgi:hypothetical protein
MVSLLIDYFWPTPGKTCLDNIGYFGTFRDVPVPPNVEHGQVDEVGEKLRSQSSTEKDVETKAYAFDLLSPERG